MLEYAFAILTSHTPAIGDWIYDHKSKSEASSSNLLWPQTDKLNVAGK